MSKSTRFIGLDDSKDSIEVAIADAGRDGEIRRWGSIENTPAGLRKLVRSLGRPKTLHFVYEAGPGGYTIHRELLALGASCIVAAPTKTPRRTGDQVKNDRRDAITLACAPATPAGAGAALGETPGGQTGGAASTAVRRAPRAPTLGCNTTYDSPPRRVAVRTPRATVRGPPIPDEKTAAMVPILRPPRHPRRPGRRPAPGLANRVFRPGPGFPRRPVGVPSLNGSTSILPYQLVRARV